jgi:predicted DNA-binding transcriptional regulator AlpA
MSMTARLLTTEDVAERFRTSPSTVRYWRHLGVGPTGIRVGRRVLYDEAECDRWYQDKLADQNGKSGLTGSAPLADSPRQSTATNNSRRC